MLSRSPLLSTLLSAAALSALMAPVALAGEGGARPAGTAPVSAAAPGARTPLPDETQPRERYRARQVVVRYGGAHAASAGAVPKTRVLKVPRGLTVAQYARRLRAEAG